MFSFNIQTFLKCLSFLNLKQNWETLGIKCDKQMGDLFRNRKYLRKIDRITNPVIDVDQHFSGDNGTLGEGRGDSVVVRPVSRGKYKGVCFSSFQRKMACNLHGRYTRPYGMHPKGRSPDPSLPSIGSYCMINLCKHQSYWLLLYHKWLISYYRKYYNCCRKVSLNDVCMLQKEKDKPLLSDDGANTLTRW